MSQQGQEIMQEVQELKQGLFLSDSGGAIATGTAKQVQINIPQSCFHQEKSGLIFDFTAQTASNFVDLCMFKYFDDQCTIFINGQIVLQVASFSMYLYQQMLKSPEFCDKYLVTKDALIVDGNGAQLKQGVFSKKYASTTAVAPCQVFIPWKLLNLQKQSEFFTVPVQMTIQLSKTAANANQNMFGTTAPSDQVYTASTNVQFISFSKSVIDPIPYLDYILMKKIAFTAAASSIYEQFSVTQNQLLYERDIIAKNTIEAGDFGGKALSLDQLTINNQVYLNITGVASKGLLFFEQCNKNVRPYNTVNNSNTNVLYLTQPYKNQLIQSQIDIPVNTGGGFLFLTYNTIKI